MHVTISRSRYAKIIFLAALLLAMAIMVSQAGGVEASSQEILEQQLEKQEEYRFWEIRTELHRIHHHLEHVPYMVYSSIGIFLALVGLLIVKIMELKK